jgi:hypothetical protein
VDFVDNGVVEGYSKKLKVKSEEMMPGVLSSPEQVKEQNNADS